MQTTGKQPESIGHPVFISYYKGKDKSTKDRNVADKICSALESRGIRCWMAPRDVLPGDEDVKAMIDAVMQSKVLVLIFSLNADKSHWVKSEVRKALDEKITIIPFCIENGFDRSILGFMVGSSHRINAHTQPRRKHLDKLVEAVSEHIKKEPERPLTVVEKKPVAVEVDVTKEVKKKEKIPKRVPQKKWILFAYSIIILVAIGYVFRYQLGIEPKRESTVLTEMLDDVRAVESKGIKVEKNKKGFWEAHYRDGIVMVYIPAGEFTMGSNDGRDDEKPPHKVNLDGYWMGKTEVTVGQYKKFISEAGHRSLPDYVSKYSPGDNHPVIGVSWDDAAAYCKWLPKKGGLKFKLPTEAQWEKAARGTDGRKYPWGNSPPSGKKVNFADKQVWLKKKYSWADKDIDDGYAYTAPVESYPQGASPYGMLNMAGNVWEWCNDWYGSDYYKKSSYKNPMGPASGTNRVLRGGGWIHLC